MEAIINPLEGITLENKKILLGMSKAEVTQVLGAADICERYYYFDSELAIDFDDNDKVEFIEFLAGKEGSLRPFIYGVSAFECDADNLVEVLKTHNNGCIDDNEDGYSYGFKEISIGIYRESTPEGVQQDIDQMTADGEFDQEYIDEEREKANHWATIGLGIRDYYG